MLTDPCYHDGPECPTYGKGWSRGRWRHGALDVAAGAFWTNLSSATSLNHKVIIFVGNFRPLIILAADLSAHG